MNHIVSKARTHTYIPICNIASLKYDFKIVINIVHLHIVLSGDNNSY